RPPFGLIANPSLGGWALAVGRLAEAQKSGDHQQYRPRPAEAQRGKTIQCEEGANRDHHHGSPDGAEESGAVLVHWVPPRVRVYNMYTPIRIRPRGQKRSTASIEIRSSVFSSKRMPRPIRTMAPVGKPESPGPARLENSSIGSPDSRLRAV